MVLGIRVVVSKEKKGKSKRESKKTSKNEIPKKTDNIVISIDKNKQISKYSKDCENILGYSKKEALNKPIFDFLIPENYSKKWNGIIDYSNKKKKIDDFKLPLLDKNGQEVWISWSYFTVKNTSGVLVDINLVGNLISSRDSEEKTIVEFPSRKTKEKIEKPAKRIDFKLEKQPKIHFIDKSDEEKPEERTDENFIKKEKSGNYSELKKLIKKLKKENSELDKKNKNLEKDLNSLKNRVENLKIKKEKRKKTDKKDAEGQQSFSELFGTKKRNQEYENLMHELNEREKYLNDLESNINKDKIKINDQVNEFKKWRKRLESLELEIENRKNDILSKENVVKEKLEYTKVLTVDVKPEEKVITYHDLLDKIPDSAVVIHRGILKQVNDSFADLIGYNIDEILNKSLFDFIIPEELTDVKDYYINRLMGVDVSTFETTLLTKENDKVSVEINTKPTDFNGKKAEIAVIKTIKSKKEEK
jgi:PAS domain S-box-containing protein